MHSSLRRKFFHGDLPCLDDENRHAWEKDRIFLGVFFDILRSGAHPCAEYDDLRLASRRSHCDFVRPVDGRIRIQAGERVRQR